MIRFIKFLMPICILLIASQVEAVVFNKKGYEFRNTGSSEISVNESVRIMQKALTTKPDEYEVHFVLGLIHYFKKDFVSAKGEFEKVIKLRPDYYLSYINLAYSIYEIDKTNEDTLLYLKKAVTYAPDKSVGYNALAYAYLVLQKPAEAADILEKGIEKIKNDASLYFNQMLILSSYYKEEEISKEKIIRNMGKAIGLSPKEEYYIALGFTYIRWKDYSKSKAVFEDALKKYPKSIYLIIGLSTTYKETNQFEKAIEIAKQALAIEPTNKDVQDEIKEYEEAYKKWKEKNPTSPTP